jgi:hypothetical protein
MRRRSALLAPPALLLTALLLAALLLAACGASPAPAQPAPPASTRVPASASPAGPAPVWPAPPDAASAAGEAGLVLLDSEGQVLHIHAHLDVFVAGQPVRVPAEIGIDAAAQRISPLHTHDDSGVIHVESPVKRDFTLGQFFAEWRQPLTGNPAGRLSVYVDGKPYAGDPAALVLREHQEIVVAYGTPPADVPADYSFAEGL